MTPELTAVAPIPMPTTESERAAATLRTIDERTRAIADVAEGLKAYMLPRLYWHGMLRGRA